MSDQDFFFDDEVVEETTDEKAVAKAAKAEAKAKAAKTKAPARVDVDDAEFSGPTITATICALAAIIALLVGIIGGIFIGRALVPPTTTMPTTQGGGMGGMGGGSAPVLSDEQMEQGMPAGHPDVSGMEGESAEDAATDDDALEGVPETP